MVIPLKIPLSLAALRATLRPSMATIKRNGDRGSPCLTPLETLNSSVGQPFTITEAREEERQARMRREEEIGFVNDVFRPSLLPLRLDLTTLAEDVRLQASRMINMKMEQENINRKWNDLNSSFFAISGPERAELNGMIRLNEPHATHISSQIEHMINFFSNFQAVIHDPKINKMELMAEHVFRHVLVFLPIRSDDVMAFCFQSAGNVYEKISKCKMIIAKTHHRSAISQIYLHRASSLSPVASPSRSPNDAGVAQQQQEGDAGTVPVADGGSPCFSVRLTSTAVGHHLFF
ncbi:hypothetical protein LXL04_022894 [Taraxacum kok-saghyz]